MRPPLPKLLAEAAGAGVLVFAGCGAIVIEDLSGGRVSRLGIAVSFGLAVALMIAAVGHISGAHFNPAVTLALAAYRHFPAQLVLPYWASQLVGAIVGALTLRLLFGSAAGLGRTEPAGPILQAFALEVVLTAGLVFVIATVALDPEAKSLAPWAIGGAVALAAMLGGPISGASMNPARSLGPAVVTGQLKSIWIYLLAPLLGGLVGITGYGLLSRIAPKAD